MCRAHFFVVSKIKKHMTEMRQACQECATIAHPDPDRVILWNLSMLK
jgi:hypothetical protein